MRYMVGVYLFIALASASCSEADSANCAAARLDLRDGDSVAPSQLISWHDAPPTCKVVIESWYPIGGDCKKVGVRDSNQRRKTDVGACTGDNLEDEGVQPTTITIHDLWGDITGNVEIKIWSDGTLADAKTVFVAPPKVDSPQ